MKLKTLDQQCAEMEALLPRVTAWPWGWDFRVGRLADIDPTIQDGTFICQARTLLPQLLQERREMQAEIERLKSWGVPNDARMCANCGRSEPCELNESEHSPCTLDPTYLDLIEKVSRLNRVIRAYEAQQTKDLEELVFLGESRAKLAEENERLREALEEISSNGKMPECGLEAEHWEWWNYGDSYSYGYEVGSYKQAEIAKKALEGGER